MVFFRVHPLAESDPAERPGAKEDTPAREALAWLEDPQPPPPPETLHQQIAREIAEAIGWSIDKVALGIAEIHDLGPHNPSAEDPDDEEAEEAEDSE